MRKRYSDIIGAVYLIGDIFLLTLSFWLAYYLRFGFIHPFSDEKYRLLLLLFNTGWIISSLIFRKNDIEVSGFIISSGRNLFKVLGLHGLLIFLYLVSFKTAEAYSRLQLLYTYLLFVPAVILWRLGLVYLLRYSRLRGFNIKNVIILGSREEGKDLEQFFRANPQAGYFLKGYFDHRQLTEDTSGLEKLKDFLTENEISEIYIVLRELDKLPMEQIRDFAERKFIKINFLPDFRGLIGLDIAVRFLGTVPVLSSEVLPLDDPLNRFYKRTFDIFFSLFVVLTVLSWLTPLLALLIKLESKGPVFFTQKRRGRNFEFFTIRKFRTMRINVESDDKQATRGDNRITRIGAFLRKTNLDELPQFFNVLLGDMSVVGPRPNFLQHSETYSEIVDRYMFRHWVRPGVTGLAQVKGCRGEIRNEAEMKQRVMYDVFYVKNRTFLLDLKIIVMTVVSMFRGDDKAV